MGNLLAAWKEFKRGKTSKPDVQEFEFNVEDHILKIHSDLERERYRPAPYESFYIADPKLRHIHKASVRDRVVHQALLRVLDLIFDKQFVHDSYSCRVSKGTHRGVRQLRRYMKRVSNNFSQPAYALKCDIKKFFSSIDHKVLTTLLKRRIQDQNTLRLLKTIVASYGEEPGKALPLGNVTSQLFANVYMNEFDQWAKHVLKARYYLRYCDDFIILHENREYLESLIPKISGFLESHLHLLLHPRKVEIRKFGQGIDFLGYVVLPHATMLRTRTKKRLFKNLSPKNLPSYLGVLSHTNARKLRARALQAAGKW